MKPLQELSEMYLKSQREKYPNIPVGYLGKKKYTDKTANGLTKCIIDFIRFKGGQAERINTTGRVIQGKKSVDYYTGKNTTKGIYIPGTGTKGSADISATIIGKSVKIEVKIGKDRQSEYQKEYQKSIETAGGIYFIATDFDSFYEWYFELFE